MLFRLNITQTSLSIIKYKNTSYRCPCSIIVEEKDIPFLKATLKFNSIDKYNITKLIEKKKISKIKKEIKTEYKPEIKKEVVKDTINIKDSFEIEVKDNTKNKTNNPNEKKNKNKK